jgi:acyl-CoA thioesterase FadM
MPEIVWTETTRVKAYECDFRGCWKPAVFLQAMQEAAANHAAHLGVGYRQLIERDMAWVLSRVKIQFLDYPRMGEEVVLRTWPRGVQQKLFFTREFEIASAEGRPLALATTGWVLIQPAQRRILPPSALASAQASALPLRDVGALDELLEKIAVPAGLPELGTFEASYNAVDVMGHANSARYIEWLEDCFPFAEHRRRRLDWIQLNFSNEVKPGERMLISAGPEPVGNGEARWFGQGSILPGGTRAFDAAFGWRPESPSGERYV